MEHPGKFDERPTGSNAITNPDRDYEERAFTVGLGGPVGSGEWIIYINYINLS